MADRIKGVVKSFRKGYGFIVGPDGRDVFCHYSFIRQTDPPTYRQLKVGQQVEYEMVQTEKGLQARDVVVIEDAPDAQ